MRCPSELKIWFNLTNPKHFMIIRIGISKYWIIAACLAVISQVTAPAALTGIFESYAILNKNGTGNTFYDAGASTGNADFQGANLGTFNSSVNSLILNGGEVKTYKNGGGDVFGAYLAYRIWSGSPAGSFTETQLFYNGELGGGDQDWKATGANIKLLQGLNNGNYTLEVYFRSPGNQGDVYDSRGGSNYQATFSVVPEPITMALPIFGGLALLLGLSRRFISR